MVWETKKYPMYYGGIKQSYPHVAPGSPVFSRSVVVGNLVFLAGSAGRTLETGDVPSDSVEEQMYVALDKIRMAVEEAGGSMSNLIKTFILLRDLEDYSPMRKTELEYYQKYAPSLVEDPPASTVMQVRSLAKPRYRVEVDAIAVISQDKIPGWEVKKYPMYYGGVKQIYPNVAIGRGFFSRAVVVGNLVFLSGAAGRTLETGDVPSDRFDDQITVALDKIRLAMEEVGSSMNNVIQIRHLCRNLEDIPCLWQTEREYFQKYAPFLVEEPPASTILQPRSLAKPRYLVELDAIGVISRDRPGWEVRKYPLYYGVKQPYAKSVRVGNLLFISAMGGQSPDAGRFQRGNLEDQMAVALDKIRLTLEQAGGSMNNIIKTMMYLRDLENYSGMRKFELEYYQKYAPLLVEDPPASTFVQPASLPNPEYLFEMEVVAVISRQDEESQERWQRLGQSRIAELPG